MPVPRHRLSAVASQPRPTGHRRLGAITEHRRGARTLAARSERVSAMTGRAEQRAELQVLPAMRVCWLRPPGSLGRPATAAVNATRGDGSCGATPGQRRTPPPRRAARTGPRRRDGPNVVRLHSSRRPSPPPRPHGFGWSPDGPGRAPVRCPARISSASSDADTGAGRRHRRA